MDEHEDHDDGRDDGVDSSSSSGSGSEGVEAGSVELRSVAEALCVEASAPALLAFARALEAAHCWGDMLAVMIIFVGQKPLALEGEGGGGGGGGWGCSVCKHHLSPTCIPTECERDLFGMAVKRTVDQYRTAWRKVHEVVQKEKVRQDS